MISIAYKYKKQNVGVFVVLFFLVNILILMLTAITCFAEEETIIVQAKILFNKGQYSESIKLCDKVIASEPQNALAYLIKAEDYGFLGNKKECMDMLYKADTIRFKIRNDIRYRVDLYKKMFNDEDFISFMGVAVKVNTKELDFHLRRVGIKNGKVMVPLKTVVEMLGGTAISNEKDITITFKNKKYLFLDKEKCVQYDGKSIPYSDDVLENNGIMQVSHTLLSENFGLKINLNKNKYTLYIDDPDFTPKYSNFWIECALAASEQLSIINSDRINTVATEVDCGNAIEEAKNTLLVYWGIVDKKSTLEKIKWLTDGGHSKSFLEDVKILENNKNNNEFMASIKTDNNKAGFKSIKSMLDLHCDGNFEILKSKALYSWDYGRAGYIARMAYVSGYISYEEALDYLFLTAEKIRKTYKSWNEVCEQFSLGRYYWSNDNDKYWESRFALSKYRDIDENFLERLNWNDFVNYDFKIENIVLPKNDIMEIVLQINNPKMIVNGIEKEIDNKTGAKPIIISNRTFIPARSLVESMGGTVLWNNEDKKITIYIKDIIIEMWIGKDTSIVNGITKTLEIQPQNIKGRTLLPVRFITENMGCNIKWSNEDEKITIQY